MLGNYEMIGQMTNQNSGYSVWGFGRKFGNPYFIKEFLSPKYPDQDFASSPEQIQRKIQRCKRFEQQKMALYRVVNERSDGNAVRIQEFFRVGSKYYIATQRIWSEDVSIQQIAAMPQQEIRRICGIIAHSIGELHKGGLIHADLKPSNILFTATRSGVRTAKIIDFDSSFLESDPPQPGDDIVGDQNYFSPEACMFLWEMEIPLTCKMDIFALGVLFHQYFTGELPDYDRENNSCPGEAVAKGMELTLSESLPEDIRELLGQMLHRDPWMRPEAVQIAGILTQLKEQEIRPTSFAPDKVEKSTLSDNPFFTPGDLW